MPPQRRDITLDEGTRLAVYLLGGLRVVAGKRTIADNEWRLRKTRNLLKLLALAPGHELHREQLFELLWPDLSPDVAAHNLHQSLYVARRALGPSGPKAARYFSLQDEVVSLAPAGAAWIDVDAFESAAQVARARKDVASYQAALALYGGELLPEDRYEDWASRRRDMLQRAHLALLFELAALYQSQRQFEPAIEALQSILQSDAANEDAHRGLMRLFALSGRRQQAVRQYQLLRETLQKEVDAPPDASTVQLYEGILADKAMPDEPAHAVDPTILPANQRAAVKVDADAAPAAPELPSQLASFVGREHELAEIERRLVTTRLLTLVGTGGCGKTRLAIQVAHDVYEAKQYPDGVWLVQLAALSEPLMVPQAVATVLHLAEQGGVSVLDRLVANLRTKHALILLDNCEHLIAACAQLAEALLSACPGLRILATSRESLHILGELAWRVPSLSLPDPAQPATPQNLMQSDAVRLFVERASSVSSDFALTEQNADDIARICARLDGIPLAIELAAVRVSALSLDQIAERLDDAFRLLTTGSRTALPRQQTLRALMDWSYALLSEAERTVLRQLSVFAGGFTLEAAEQVCGSAGTWPAPNDPAASTARMPSTLDLLTQLVNKSLVQCEPEGEGVRYRLLHTVRMYAADRLLAARETDGTRRRHRTYYLALAEMAEPQLLGPQQASWLARLEREYENLVDALVWSRQALAGGDPAAGEHAEMLMRLAGALWSFWYARGSVSEGRRWLAEALTHRSMLGSHGQAALAKVLVGGGALAWLQGNFTLAESQCQEALDLARPLGSTAFIMTVALSILGLIALDRGDMALAARHHEEALRLMRATGNQFGIAFALDIIASVARHSGDYARASSQLTESLGLQREIGDRWGAALSLHNLGQVALDQGDLDRAHKSNLESLSLFQALSNAWGQATSLALEGEIDSCRADYPSALKSFEGSLALFQKIEDSQGIAQVLHGMASVLWAQGNKQKAREYVLESISIRRGLSDRSGLIANFKTIALMADAAGQPRRAARLLAAADAIEATTSTPAQSHARYDPGRALADLRARLQDPALAADWEAGRLLNLDQAAQYAIEEALN